VLGIRELRRRRLVFLLIMGVVSLVAYLVIMVNAIGVGMDESSGSAVNGFRADAIAYSELSGRSIIFSEFTSGEVEELRTLPGVRQAGVLAYISAIYPRRDGLLKPGAFFGFDPGSVAAPEVVSGRTLTLDDRDGMLADRTFLRLSGKKIGDEVTITLRKRARTFRILGAIDEGYFFFQPVAYILRPVLTEMLYGIDLEDAADGLSLARIPPTAAAAAGLPVGDGETRRPLPGGGEIPEAIANPFPISASILLLHGKELKGKVHEGTELLDKPTAFANIEGVALERQVVAALTVLGYAVGAAVTTVFFYLLTLQKIPQIGMLKAIGATNGFVVRQMLVQVLLIAAIAIAISLSFAVLSDRVMDRIPDTVPVVLSEQTMATTFVLLIGTAILGTLLSAAQILRVDPIIALGQQQ
jgi:putative ABC transport system permease protein